MNGGFQTSRDEIGIDPTTIEIVDSLDVETNNGSTNDSNDPNNKKGRTKSLITKIVFAFGILLLMGLVAFGVYFYLNLGKKKVNEKPKFILSDKEIYIGTKLSDSILDYGNFSDIDISGCTLDTSKVDTSKVGTYEYSMVCDGSKYTGKITIINKYDFEITANILYKTSDDVLIASEFIEGDNDYKYTIKDNNIINNLYTPGGPYYTELEIENTKDETKGTVSSIFYVTESAARTFLTCTSTVKKNDDADGLSYRIVDTFAFDRFRMYLHVPARMYVFEFIPTENYVKLITSMQNGMIEFGSLTGYGLRDDVNNTFRIVSEINDETLEEEMEGISLTYDNIKKYYEDNDYTCK